MKWITNGSCLEAREHKIYLSEVAKIAICIKIPSIFILNSLTWASCLPAHSYALVAVGHAITKLLCSSEYLGHQVNEFFCREMPLNKDFSPCLVILPFLSRALVYRWLMLPVRGRVWCSPHGCSGLFFSVKNTRQGLSSRPELPLLVHWAGMFPPSVDLVWTPWQSLPALSVGFLHKGWTWLFNRVTFPSGLTRWAHWHGIRKPISDSLCSAAAAELL